MLRLILLRHAKAAAHAGGGDAERPLTERGRADAARVGEFLAANGLFPDLAVASAAKRTSETLDLALDAFGEPCPVRRETRLYLAEPRTLLTLLRQTPDFVRVLLACGHNPGLHDFALDMSRDSETRRILEHGFPTAALAVIDFAAASWAAVEPGSGALERFLTPDRLPPH